MTSGRTGVHFDMRDPVGVEFCGGFVASTLRGQETLDDYSPGRS
ncbi:hypothetical protein [Mycolicibacterium sp. XJ870]